ncbi:hypothetical protein BCR43DRAFT_482716 [Syncephalastrum racemosum]|uniref:BZIP domain-containing protein n=1 Tax=Syncephalastrum racemosum TaxID=13706 RepID=A0A1X2HUB1_SYNRA|nr:hypothetical protein BCR43DRAFT_482716 [Syncephalastrum racemosum]
MMTNRMYVLTSYKKKAGHSSLLSYFISPSIYCIMAATQSTESLKQSQGGRHRIFTAEQRKDRNRLAQAAFRERRNQYTSTLEKTVIELETIIRELQVGL